MNNTKDKVIDIKQKISINTLFENSTKIIAVFTVICTIILFLIRGFWYVYQCGYFSVLGLERIYIDVDDSRIIYNVLAYFGIAVILFSFNAFSYLLCIRGKKRYLLLFLFVQAIILWIIVIVLSGHSIVNVLFDVVKQKQFLKYQSLAWKILLIVFTMNVYGICFGFIWKKENREECVAMDYSLKEIGEGLIFFLLVVAAEGVAMFCMGTADGNARESYKLILENIETGDGIEDKYLFEAEKDYVRAYPILYENKEIYVISYLCIGDDGVYIETKYQKVIPKINVETIYCENINNFLTSNLRKEEGIISVNENNKEENSENKITLELGK